jgi:hypothetical protein
VSLNAAFGGILLFLVSCFDLFFGFFPIFWVEEGRGGLDQCEK